MAIYKDFKTISQLYQIMTKEFGKGMERPALKHRVGEQWVGITYDELARQTDLFALGLAAMGVKRNDKISIIAENRPEWVYSDFAILGLGGIDVPLYPISTSETIEFCVNNSESVGIIVSNKFQLNKVLKVRNNCKTLRFIVIMNNDEKGIEKDVFTFADIQAKGLDFQRTNPSYFEDSLKICQENDLCTIIYTSGTTGEPKGVVLTHKNITSNVKGAHEVFDIGETDIFLSFLPLCHIFERMGGYYTAFSCGAIIAYAESIEKVSQNLKEIQPTIMTAVPRLFERIYSKIKRNVESQPEKKQKIFNWAIELGKEFQVAKKSGHPIPIFLSLKRKLADKLVFHKLREATGGRLRFFISGGAALSRELGLFFEAVGILVIEGYGLTESSPVLSCNRVNDYKFGTVGKPYPGVEIKIAKDGEILAYGP
ncbi:MAG: AMP-binding protein, partial [Ignavibacteria bacterium]|nr:AMP-binding protein [Ignavibacteria bacterium]